MTTAIARTPVREPLTYPIPNSAAETSHPDSIRHRDCAARATAMGNGNATRRTMPV